MALLIAVKLLSGVLEHREPAAAPAATTTPTGPAVPAPTAGTPPPRRSRLADQSSTAPTAAARRQSTSLEHAARAVRDDLRRDGHPLTRDALAARLRAAGHPVRNATLTAILATLRAEPTSVT